MSTGPDAVTVWEGKYIKVLVDGTWEYVGRTRDIQAAVILALHGDAVILVEQYRVPLGRRCLELPAGLVGDEQAGESVEASAGRELEEETGYRAARLETLGVFQSSPGMVSEGFTLVRATGLERVGPGGGVSGEDITVHRVSLADVGGFVAAKRVEGVAIDVRLLLLLGAAMLPPHRNPGPVRLPLPSVTPPEAGPDQGGLRRLPKIVRISL